MKKKRKPRRKKPKKTAIRTFKVVNDVWSYAIFVRIGGSVEQAAKAMDKLFESSFAEDNSNPHALARCFLLDNEKSHLIWFRESPGAGLLTHEVLHSVHHVLDCSGMQLNRETEEAYAYLIDWTVRQIGFKIW
ncbi:MAG: hypothetical protein R3359_12955 [Marinirhabdus sp.]|nr:hypothetical protein [Marinirhabdus sp.]